MELKRGLPSLEMDFISHINKIILDLEFKQNPVIFYGEKAFDYARRNIPEYHNKKDKEILRSVGGYFHYENVPRKYKKTGVVCVLNGKISTLAHELCHAKQFQNKTKWMQRGKWLKFFYKNAYAFYPTEIKAFLYAETYLIKSKLYISSILYFFKILKVFFINNRIFWPAYIVIFGIYYIKVLQRLFLL